MRPPPCTFVCFWCQRELARRGPYQQPRNLLADCCTLEHLVPLCLGGTSARTNLKDVCYGCNQRRGRITTVWGELRHLTGLLSRWKEAGNGTRKWLARCVRRAQRRLPVTQAQQRHWIALEKARLGYSPLATLTLELPPGPWHQVPDQAST